MLVGGSLVYFVGGYLIASRNPELARADAATAQGLSAIAAHPGAWRLTVLSQGLAIVMTVAGLAAIPSAAGAEAWISTVAFGAGAALMLGYLGFHLTETVRAGQEYEQRRRSYARLYRVYMVVAYLAFAHLGALFLVHDVRRWLGWFLVAAGVFGAVTMIVRRPRVRGLLVSDLPLWIHVIAGIAGIGLISTASR